MIYQKKVYFWWLFLIGIVLGLIAGGALGIALGLIFAPKAGREFRKELWAKLKEVLPLIKERIRPKPQQVEE